MSLTVVAAAALGAPDAEGVAVVDVGAGGEHGPRPVAAASGSRVGLRDARGHLAGAVLAGGQRRSVREDGESAGKKTNMKKTKPMRMQSKKTAEEEEEPQLMHVAATAKSQRGRDVATACVSKEGRLRGADELQPPLELSRLTTGAGDHYALPSLLGVDRAPDGQGFVAHLEVCRGPGYKSRQMKTDGGETLLDLRVQFKDSRVVATHVQCP